MGLVKSILRATRISLCGASPHEPVEHTRDADVYYLWPSRTYMPPRSRHKCVFVVLSADQVMGECSIDSVHERPEQAHITVTMRSGQTKLRRYWVETWAVN